MSEGEVVYTTETRHPVVSVTTYDEQTHCELDHEGGVCGRPLSAIRRLCPIHGEGAPVTYTMTEDRLADDRTEDLWPREWRTA